MNEGETKHTLDRYNSEKVSNFLDGIIKQVEQMVSEIQKKDMEIALKDQKIAERDKRIQELLLELESKKVEQGNPILNENMDSTLKQAIVLAQENSRKLEQNAQMTANMIIEEARRNADRIVNESLLKAEKTEMETNMLKRNIELFKSRIKKLVDSQLEIVEELDKIDI